jgi:hypothetical protein
MPNLYGIFLAKVYCLVCPDKIDKKEKFLIFLGTILIFGKIRKFKSTIFIKIGIFEKIY